jgi:O-antigen/teichoic acid export membrane protein
MRRPARTGSWALGGNVLLLVLTLGTGITAARFLGPDVRGEVAGTQAVMTVLAVLLTLGVPQALVTWHGRLADVRRMLVFQLLLAFAVGVVAALLLWWTGIHPWLDGWAVVGAGLWVTGSVAISVDSGLAQRQAAMRWRFQAVRVVPMVVLLLVMFGLVAGDHADSTAWLLASGVALAGSSVPPLVWRLRKDDGGDPASTTFARTAVLAWSTAVAAQVIYRLDAVGTSLALPARQIGLYAVALAAAGACFAVGSAAGMTVFSRLRQERDRDEQDRILRRGIRHAVLAAGAVAVPTIALAPWLIRLVYGEDFVGAAPATRVLVAASVFWALDFLLVHALLVLDGARAVLRIQALTVVLTVVLIVLALEQGSIVAVALVSLVVYPLSAALMWRRTRVALAVE